MAGQPSIGVLLLRDLRTVFAGRDKLPTETILTALHSLDESPWADLRGKPVDARWLSRQLSKYEVKSKTVRTEEGTAKGYDAGDLADPWGRYVSDAEDPFRELRETTKSADTDALGAPVQGSVTSDTSDTDPTLNLARYPGRCPSCGFHIEKQGHRDTCPERSAS